MRMLYDYMTGDGFRQSVQGVARALADMQDDLNQERNAIIKLWRKRDTQLLRAQENLASLWGRLQGIAGRQITDIEQLTLPGDTPRSLTVGLDPPEVDDDTDEPDAAAVSGLDQDFLVDLFYSLLPEDGTSVGNKSHFDHFEQDGMKRHAIRPTQQDYDRCKERLLADGRIRRGRGRGGSLARLTASTPEDEP